MRFEWDIRKANQNLKKHQISFEEAITAFDDPMALIAPDEKHSQHELREWLIGETDTHQLIVVIVFTKRENGQIYRLISARPANQKERKLYESYKRISL